MNNTNSTHRGGGTSANYWSWFSGGAILTYLGYLLLCAWSALTLFSFGWVVATSLKTNREVLAPKTIWALPKVPQFINFVTAWQRSKMGTYFYNSVVVTVSSTVLIAVIAAMAAYILARFRFRGASLLLYYFLVGTAIPMHIIIVPIYLLYSGLGLLNSLIGLIFVYTAVSLPFSVFVLTGFFRSLPHELEEAGVLDGASESTLFFRIVAPLAMPGIVSVSIFNALGIWNDYLLAFMLMTSPEKRTIPVGLYNLKIVQTYAADWVTLFAGVVIVLVPSVVIYLSLHQRITSGLTVGAIKG